MHRLSDSRGFSLLELLIVLGIITSVSVFAVSTLDFNWQTPVERESAMLARGIETAFARAVSTQATYRLVINLDNQAYAFQMTGVGERVMLEAEHSITEADTSASDQAAADQQQETVPQSSFSSAADEGLVDGQLPEDVRFYSVRFPELSTVYETGQISLMFFPSGQTRFVAIVVGETDGDARYTLILNPISGQVQIEQGELDDETIKQVLNETKE